VNRVGWQKRNLLRSYAIPRGRIILARSVRRLKSRSELGFDESGDLTRARQAFIERGGIAVTAFDRQVKEIQQAGFPASLDCVVVPALSASRVFLDPRQIESLVFP
jgi:hypothetical protein